MKLLVINGPNINMLGIREKNIYGSENFQSLIDLVENTCHEKGIVVECYQSNHEGDIVDKIQAAYQKVDGIVINGAAYTHTSVAILDALKAVQIPAVEVHISDIYKREEFRHISYEAPYCLDQIKGHGFDGYIEAMDVILAHLDKTEGK